MSKQSISPADSATSATGKINSNFDELYSGQGGGSSQADVIARNQEAVARISAARKHVLLTGVNQWKYNPSNNFVVAHGSDFHADRQRWRNFLDFSEGVDTIDLLIATGDFPAQTCKVGTDQIDYMMDELDAADITKPILLVTGNHDRYGLTNAQVAGAFDLQGRGLRADNNNSYYYKDFPNNNNEAGTGAYPSSYPDCPSPNINKLRFIVLNQYDVTSTSNTVIGKDYHITQAQIDWFLDVLASTPPTTGVIVCMHGRDGIDFPTAQGKKFNQRYHLWARDNNSLAYNGTLFEDIIAAFRAGGSINKTFSISNNDDPTVTVNKTFSQAGSFICYMIGHSHMDIIGYSTTHPDQLYLHCPVSCHTPDYDESGNFQTNPNSYGNQVTEMPRRLGDKTEDCFNVYGIDTVSKVIKVVRVGSDINDLGDDKRMDWYEYEPTIS